MILCTPSVASGSQSTSTTHFSYSSKYRRTSLHKTYHRLFDFSNQTVRVRSITSRRISLSIEQKSSISSWDEIKRCIAAKVDNVWKSVWKNKIIGVWIYLGFWSDILLAQRCWWRYIFHKHKIGRQDTQCLALQCVHLHKKYKKITIIWECKGNNFCVNKSTLLMQQRTHKYIQKISHCRICACDIFICNYLP